MRHAAGLNPGERRGGTQQQPAPAQRRSEEDGPAGNRPEAARSALESLGSGSIRHIRYRDSWCMIGEKGAARGSVPESHVPCGQGSTTLLTREYDMAQRRERLLAQAAVEEGLLGARLDGRREVGVGGGSEGKGQGW